MDNAINSFGVGRIARMLLAEHRPKDRGAALASLRMSLGPYDRDDMLEAAVNDYFVSEDRRIAD